jgi:hypothetical protein
MAATARELAGGCYLQAIFFSFLFSYTWGGSRSPKDGVLEATAATGCLHGIASALAFFFWL